MPWVGTVTMSGQRLASPKLTLRQKSRIQAAVEQAQASSPAGPEGLGGLTGHF
jgi:hypothetical protein